MQCNQIATIASVFIGLLGGLVAEGNGAEKNPVAGKADVLRHVPKDFATLLSVDLERKEIEIQIENASEPSKWKLESDAELKVHGWWGRLEQFSEGDRVWVWRAIDRKKKPKGVLMLADELSEQAIHQQPHMLKGFDPIEGTITVKSKIGDSRMLSVDGVDCSDLLDKEVYIQSSGDRARVVISVEQFGEAVKAQEDWLREQWRERGLPGTVTVLHPFSGEMELMLDHEAIRWGRYLKNGDQVTLNIDSPITATVKHVQAWRERTLVRLVTDSGVDQLDLSLGQRLMMKVPEPPVEIQDLELPTDIGRLTSKRDRAQWFLASVYCSCKIAGDRCTGMFYSLASCNVNACGMPNQIRQRVDDLIDEGLTDEQIWRKLHEEQGPSIALQHLLH